MESWGRCLSAADIGDKINGVCRAPALGMERRQSRREGEGFNLECDVCNSCFMNNNATAVRRLIGQANVKIDGRV
jgi:hypothetical protein